MDAPETEVEDVDGEPAWRIRWSSMLLIAACVFLALGAAGPVFDHSRYGCEIACIFSVDMVTVPAFAPLAIAFAGASTVALVIEARSAHSRRSAPMTVIHAVGVLIVTAGSLMLLEVQ